MKTSSSHIVRIFVAGLLAALPLIATAALLYFVGHLIVDWLGPNSFFGRLMGKVGLGVAAAEWVGYMIGFTVVGILLFSLGVVVERGLQRWFNQTIDTLVRRIPVVRTVYDTVKNFVELLSKRDKNQMSAMQAVWVHFGGPGGASALALLSSPETVIVNQVECLAVIIPTAPVPIGGGLLFVPKAWVTASDLGMDAVTSIYVSMGMTSAQMIKRPVVRQAPGV
jgi:uncharacterized membrane protein